VTSGTADPYRVWLSEIMLQQTTVKAVIPYFLDFVSRWPTMRALAAAPLDDVLSAWAGLGYYSRARNLHKCAVVVVESHSGQLPSTEAQLLELPGIGPYTAAAIAAIAFGARSTPVDGNIERVVARLFAVRTALPDCKPELRRLATSLTPSRRAGDHAQAMMDLGATICTPRTPACALCPIRPDCRAFAEGVVAAIPARKAKPDRPVRRGTAFLVLREDGHVLLRKRAERGLLGGMLEVPSTEWREGPSPGEPAQRELPVHGTWHPVPGVVVHTFTHFRLEMNVYRSLVERKIALAPAAGPDRCRWVARRDLDRAALPSVMRKIIAHGLPRH
jgi:A/G-specific adenine glycosylase